MSHQSTIIAVYMAHAEADKAVRDLAAAGIAVKHISVVGKGYHTEEKVMGFYNTGERMRMWGTRGAFWGSLWGMLFGGIFMVVPVVGHVVVLGYLATTVIAALEGAVVFGGLGAIGAGLAGLGIPENSVIRYETDVKADSFLVMVSGTDSEVAQARTVLLASDPSRLDVYDSVTA